jgi:hypothetical protein
MPSNVEFVYPIKGFNQAYPASEQPQLTSGNLKNTRPFDCLASRMRGGKRPGLNKWGNRVQIGSASQPIVALTVVDSIS